MCIAILNKSTVLNKDVFINSFQNNPDGIGMAFSDGTKVQTVKRMTDPSSLYDVYLKIRYQTDLPIMIHSRIGTSGKKDLSNVHPFKINENLAFMHNGVISYTEIYNNESDTRHIARFMQALSDPDTLLDELSIEYSFILELAGYGSKFIFMHSDGRYSIMNEQKGHWDDDADTWYSNDGYKKIDYSWYGNQKVYKSGSAKTGSGTGTGTWCNDWYTGGNYVKKSDKNMTHFETMEKKVIEYFHYTKEDFFSLSDNEVADLVQDVIDWFGMSGGYYKALKDLYKLAKDGADIDGSGAGTGNLSISGEL